MMLYLDTSVKRKIDLSRLVVYFSAFFIIWALNEIIIDPFINENYSFIFHLLFRRILKITVWVVPVFLYLRYVDCTNAFTFIKANKYTIKSLKWTVIGIGFYTLRTILQLRFTPSEMISMNLGVEAWTGAVLFVGITEEIVFRGFLLEKLRRNVGFGYSNIISSILFVLIHFPIWYMRGILEFPTILLTMISVFIISIFQGYIFNKGESIWPSAISHSVNNFLVLAIVSK